MKPGILNQNKILFLALIKWFLRLNLTRVRVKHCNNNQIRKTEPKEKFQQTCGL